ncbi:tripartite motif-containing protein 16-like [Chaetodon trifascialis]|uniref:tripartite motif-containing protein 16-like n=1 Tax=Chaetodon trifascialis TaxID=109706 RepID=UPI00399297E3
MAQHMVQLDREKLSCSICLDLLKDPVTIPCGHSYCMSCINDCWEEKNEGKTHSCPQCRQSFTQKPVLVKSTMLAELVEEMKKAGLQAAPADHSYAGPGDVACDFCTGKKLKALKSCLVCMACYCEQHLQPHYNVAPLKKHKLVEATSRLHENICSLHDEVMKIFCRTDRQCICYLCSMDDHKGHDTVSAAAERAERQAELGLSLQKIQQRIQDREKEAKALQRRVEAINLSADEAVRDSEKIFTELIRLIEERSSEVKQQIRSKQKTEVGRAKELEEKLQEEITELQRRDAELQTLSHTEDHLHFLNNYPSLSHLGESESLIVTDTPPLCSFEGVTAAVSEAKDKLQAVLREEWPKISVAVAEVDVLLPKAEPTSRAEHLKYSCQITLDPNTANTYLSLCDRNKKVKLIEKERVYLAHPDRFFALYQVLSREGLTGRCYWEVKWTGRVIIAVAYKNIIRRGSRDECGFGFNDKSWSLDWRDGTYIFRHNGVETSISGPQASTVGVYLDHQAGILSFYSVSETMTLLHRVQTTFTQPLHPGFWFPVLAAAAAELCELK